MTRTAPAILALAAVLLTGCSAAEDIASDAASAAGASAREAALRELEAAVCPLVADNTLSEADRSTLASAIDVAQGLGVESELLTAAEDINNSDGTPPESELAALAEACR
ncbi:hypothetical protein N802_05335 [Knoellia sinensis KCTC 19936]|uniref:Lipoprotein n=1 Tax=Knoellia sinensis KCTC 19936 TaxID=1385520 RepID=A0A0A0J2Y1_9MICO|nr:hypothetical protein [Knoellia sinensis]KGN31029.1 hypothetical protein N802_05335 [Knoellia sinensis KCTC 19936]